MALAACVDRIEGGAHEGSRDFTRLVVSTHKLGQDEHAAEGEGEGEGCAELLELMLDKVNVSLRTHPAGRVQQRRGNVWLVAQQPARRVVVGWLILPYHRFSQPMPLAVGAAILECGVHRIGLKPAPLRQPARKVIVPTAEESEGQHATDDLLVEATKESNV